MPWVASFNTLAHNLFDCSDGSFSWVALVMIGRSQNMTYVQFLAERCKGTGRVVSTAICD